MSYKLYQSKKWIFWDAPNQIDYPDFITNDSYFDWELVESNNINFETYKSGKITVKDTSMTYFKLEKENGLTRYWFVKDIANVLKDGFIYNVELDFYMTYTRLLLNELTKTSNKNVLLNTTRASLATGMLNDDDLKNIVIMSSKLKDPLIDQIQKIYSDQVVKNTPHTGTIQVQDNDGTIRQLHIRTGAATVAKKDFLGCLNVCAVFINKKYSEYHVMPLIDAVKTQNVDGSFPQLYSGPESGKFINYFNSVENMLDILPKVNEYGVDGFVGFFKYPYRFGNYKTSRITKPASGDSVIPLDERFLFWTFNPLTPNRVNYPLNVGVNVNDSLVELFGELHDEIQFSQARNKKLHYFKHIKKLSNGNYSIQPTFNLSFANEFLLVPDINQFCDANDIEGFGGVLPSPDSSYVKQIYEAKKNYDMGLTSIANNYGNLGTSIATSALFGGAAGGIWGAAAGGVSSLISGIVTNELQRKQLTKAYEYQVSGASQSWVSSNTTDIWYFTQFYRAVKNDTTMWQPSTLDQGLRQLWFEFPLSNVSKTLIKQTYHLFGFPVNALVSFGKLLDRSHFINRFYIELDQDWIINNIRHLAKLNDVLANESSEVLNIIANQMSNGLRIWTNNAPNYNNFAD